MPLRLIVTYARDFLVSPLQDRAMGGIQTALLGLGTALARRGHDVHLFANCPETGRHDGVEFHERDELARFAGACPAEVLIVIPEVLPLLMPVRARARVVWSGNAHATGDCAIAGPWDWQHQSTGKRAVARLFSMALLHPYADRLFVKSCWQARYLGENLGIPADKFRVVYNGVPLEHYQGPAPYRHRHRLVFTSEARRGLDVLLRLFPQVRAQVPVAELHVFGMEHNKAGMPPDLPGGEQPGVHWRGRLGKGALARELRTAGLMAYPCHFKETFCTAVAEAQAAGLPVVTSALAALSERVSDGVDGFLIPDKPGRNPEYEPAFLKAVLRLLRDDPLWLKMSSAAAEKAHRLYAWDPIAALWEEELGALVAGHEPAPPRHDPDLNLLNPAWLRVANRKEWADVPPRLAEDWMRQAWACYGYEPSTVPGLPAQKAPRLDSTAGNGPGHTPGDLKP